MKEYLKKNKNILIIISFLLVLGTIFLLLRKSESFILIFAYIMAVYLVIISGVFIYVALKPNREAASFLYTTPALITEAMLLIVLAVLILFYPKVLMVITIAIVLMITPAVLLIGSQDKKKILSNNLWKPITGIALILIILIPKLQNIAFIILGCVLYFLAIFLVYLIIINKEEKPNLFDKYLVRFLVLLYNKKGDEDGED